MKEKTAHAKLSASSSHRWLKCSGSVLLEADYQDETPSEYAEYGTAGHKLAEYCLKDEVQADLLIGHVLNRSKHFPDGFKVDEEMADAVQMYLDYCNQIKQNENIWFAARRVDFSKYVPKGFGTADFICQTPDILHVVDLKMGKGVKVHAEWNTQGMLYALGSIDESIDTECTVRISIVQPRLDHVSEWDISVGDLIYWAEKELTPKARQAWEEKPIFNAGEEQCRFCKAQSTCKALAEYSLKTAIDTFTDIPSATETNLKDIYQLNNEELGRLLPKVKTIITWANSLETLALKQLKLGQKITGYKLVRGRAGNRKWDNEEQIITHLKGLGLSENDIFNSKIKSPVGILAELKRNSIPSTGVEAFWNVPVGKLTIANEADNRPEIVATADSAFVDIES